MWLLAKHYQPIPTATETISAANLFLFRYGKTHGDTPMKKLLTLRDLMLILNLSEATLRRRIAESRAGIGNFPKPVTGFRRKLLFRPEDIESWAGCQQSVPVAKNESSTQRQRRHSAAMKRLQSKGVRVPNSKPQDKST